jgi:hypothetical protein
LLVRQSLVVIGQPVGPKRSDHAMMQRPAQPGSSRQRAAAANDNVPACRAPVHSAQDLLWMPFIPRRPNELVPPPQPFRIGVRPLLIVGFSGLILVALCGAFLLGLVFVGVLAAAVAVFELVRRYLRRQGRLVPLHRPVVG